MKTMKRIITYCCLISTFILSCKNETEQGEKEKISPDVVNISATASGNETEEKHPKFEFAESNFDFGTINSGDEITHDFKFKNVGNADLIITQAKGSCGCTQPKYPEKPVAPGDEGVISVTFRSAGIAGQVVKDITILANTSPTTKVLTISGEVIKINEKINP